MDKHNPYAPSRASLAGATARPLEGSGGAWRDGTVLVLSPDASLPQRCVKCNEPAEQPSKRRRVYWHSPWIYLLILVNILIYAIVAIIARKKAVIAPGLCATHKARRRIGVSIAWALLFIGLIALFMGGANRNPGAALGGILLILIAAVVSMSVARVLRAKRIDSRYVRLKGCGTAFLDSMPRFPG